MASLLGMAALAGSISALRAQTPQSSGSDKPSATTAPANKTSPAKPTPTSSASTTRSSTDAAKPPAQTKTAGMVWVNTASGMYHKQGSRWYGKTKKGKYMLEEDAIKAGYKPAK